MHSNLESYNIKKALKRSIKEGEMLRRRSQGRLKRSTIEGSKREDSERREERSKRERN